MTGVAVSCQFNLNVICIAGPRKVNMKYFSRAFVGQTASLPSKQSFLAAFFGALLLCFSVGVTADDTDILFTDQSVAPNILFVLDISGSMGWNGASRKPDNSFYTRMEEMRSALGLLIDGMRNVNVGIMTFSNGVTLVDQVNNIENNRGDLKDTVDPLEDDNGGTQTVRALWEAKRYFSNELRDAPSPIAHECQENHIVLVSDGAPDGASRSVQNAVADAARVRRCARADVPKEYIDRRGNIARWNTTNNGNCGVELTSYLFDTDLSDGRNGVDGKNNLITHTIGFNYDHAWLPSLAAAGGGKGFTVDSAAGLQEAFDDIFDGLNSTFASPTVSTSSFNQSRHRDELFYSQFQPHGNVQWQGNVKKYRIVDGQLVDADEIPVLGDDGQILKTSRSLWAASDDGGSVSDGGFAALIPPYAQSACGGGGPCRYWYTDAGRTPAANGRITPLRVRSHQLGRVSPESLGLANRDNQGRNDLLSWMLHPNLSDHYVADALHNSPVLLSYWLEKNSDPQKRKEVLFSSTNMGMLHAIDADTGLELWSYSPAELLPNIKSYYENENQYGDGHVYGLDGSFTLHTTAIEDARYEYKVNKAWLYMTERRGGNRVYALDVTNGHRSRNPFSVMWKITGGTSGPFDTDSDGDNTNDRHAFADLAQTWSKPEMMSVRTGCPDGCEIQEVLMFGGGYNPDYDDVNLDYSTYETAAGRPATEHGNAVYMVNPETGKLLWSVGNGPHHTLNLPMNHSIPSTPVPVDTDLDGAIDVLFFVDIAGDVWRVDFKAAATGFDSLHLSGGKIASLSPAGQALRFFNPLGVSLSGTSYSTAHFYLVTGSGMRSSPTYFEPHKNRLYSIKDRWVHQAPYRKDVDGAKYSDYKYVTDPSGSDHKIITADADVLRDVSDAGSNTKLEYGFFKPFALGEKILQSVRIHRSRIFSNTYVPPDPNDTDNCSVPVGSTRLYITSLSDGSDLLPTGDDEVEGTSTDTYGTRYIDIGIGLISGGEIVDTGEGNAPYFIVDKEAFSVAELVAPDNSANSEVFRKFHRTGWVEQDVY